MSLLLDIESRLNKHDIDSSRVNAEIMLSTILGCDRIGLYSQEIVLNPDESKLLEDMITRRINGEPLQHIVGKAYFYGNKLLIEKGVFIPRPETEILIEAVLEVISDYNLTAASKGVRVFDICTGSGNIAISLTKALTHCKIIASDISCKALELARKNALLNKVSERIEFIEADLFDMSKGIEEDFDIIVSNPPYIPRGIIDALGADVKNDPKEALDGGEDGMNFYSRIIEGAPRFLKKGGIIALELGDDACGKVKKLFELKGFKDIRIFKDLNRIERVIIARYYG